MWRPTFSTLTRCRGRSRGVEVVFHLAAVVSVVGDPTGMVWKVNVDGAQNAAEAALERGVRRFVHCSSAHAFDIESCGPSLDEDGPVRSDSTPRSMTARSTRVSSVCAR
ncbi:MAG: NAD-dependent epimerase/dehydratase family protein [Microthrixaceae bacterium]|nr:NAD-dependent epimerase/dehydratase family protein [Microthrixaceae bacterium]